MDPPGFSRHGIDAKAVLEKFNTITAARLSRSSRGRIIEAAMGLDKAASCVELTAALANAKA